ncbi:MAG TPA: VIT domain-containing protein [Longimicrobiales bacterium]|nr:VIT domain-containing protein [Longimicrobiales bacterium]
MRWFAGAALVLAVSSPAAAQGWIEGVEKVRTAVNVEVSGRVARVEVEEWFRNNGQTLGEADYLYPLPSGAVFNNFSLFQGDKELRGETMDADRARAIYEDIVRRKKDPALIELAGHGLLRSRVFPIATGETRKITLRYTQVLARAGDALQFKYAAGMRHSNNIGRDMPIAVRRDGGELTFNMVIQDGRAYGTPFSPTHELRVQRNANRITVRPEEALAGDFELFMPLARGAVGMTVVAHRPSSEPGFFMLTLSPGNADAAATVSRDITAVVDVSGSMSGEKMMQARNALHALLESLSANDRFRLIAFSDQVRAYRSEWTHATPAATSAARRWIDRLQAEGGTNIAGALNEAFEAESPDSRVPFVIFITDGLPSIGEQNPERIAARVERDRGRARIFAFGVGYDVNTYLLDRLSAAARGSTQYVQPSEDVERAIGRLAQKIQRPVLTDLRIVNAPGRLEEVYPAQLPDLFAGEELVIFGRYDGRGTLRAPITVTGRRAGRTESFSTVAVLPGHRLDNDFIPKLWAARKVGALAQQIKLHGQNPELLEALRATALRYGIVSEYTSYLVLEEDARPMVARDAATGRAAGRAGNVAAAPPPAMATGQSAVMKAESMRRAREARSTADLAHAEEAMQRAAAASSSSHRSVGGRSYENRGGVWTDVTLRAKQDVVHIEPFSNAYFAVLRTLPELAPVWKVLPSSVTAGKRVGIGLKAGGRKQLTQQELNNLVTRFRS